MSIVALIETLVGAAIILVVMADAFETILLPRRVSRRLRLTRIYYQFTWPVYKRIALRLLTLKARYAMLGIFAPASLLVLFTAWAIALIVGFAIVHISLGTGLKGMTDAPNFDEYIYFSGVTFLTLGYGDVSPIDTLGRGLAVLEAGLGFGFLAIVIGYVPVIYSAFSRRELEISLLDARAGSPPTSAEFLARMGEHCDEEILLDYFEQWEVWSAEVLESHLSFPILAFFRSQHDNQSWLAALTMMLDTSAIVLAGIPEFCPYHARLAFANARHTAVDLAQTFLRVPLTDRPDRLDSDRARRLIDRLNSAGLALKDEQEFLVKLRELRELYEPFIQTLSEYCHLDLPPFVSDTPVIDNWRTSAWMRRSRRLEELAGHDDHAD
ncbi:MAG: potassium channel family protein [Isosphaeraceae bacterium]|nr:potassium channel family protein [Isosphaeraceae bacterium]